MFATEYRSGGGGGGGGNLPARAAGTAAAGAVPSPLSIAATQLRPTRAPTKAVCRSAPPLLQYMVTDHFFREVPPPLPASAEAPLFAEGRVFEHLQELTVEIGHRQVGAGRSGRRLE